MEIRFPKAARKHRIGRAHAVFVMSTTQVEAVTIRETGEPERSWIGEDDRGLELEIIALVTADVRRLNTILLVIHVMPTALRDR